MKCMCKLEIHKMCSDTLQKHCCRAAGYKYGKINIFASSRSGSSKLRAIAFCTECFQVNWILMDRDKTDLIQSVLSPQLVSAERSIDNALAPDIPAHCAPERCRRTKRTRDNRARKLLVQLGCQFKWYFAQMFIIYNQLICREAETWFSRYPAESYLIARRLWRY